MDCLKTDWIEIYSKNLAFEESDLGSALLQQFPDGVPSFEYRLGVVGMDDRRR
jgi:hypothetical protein